MGRVTVTIDTDVGVQSVGLEIRVGVVFVVVDQNVARNRKRHFLLPSVWTILHSLSVLGMPVNK